MTVLALADASFRRLLRDRTAAFFLVVFPLLVILVIGMTAEGFSELKVAVVDRGAGQLGRELTAALERDPALRVEIHDDLDAARTAVRRVEVSAVVELPAGMDGDLRAGRPVEVPVYGERSDTTHQAARAAIASVVAEEGARVQAALFTEERVGASFDAALAAATATAGGAPVVDVETRVVDAESDVLPEGFSYSAPTMLVLFVFTNALAAGAAIIETRQLGIHHRMLAAPVSPAAVVVGEAVTYVAIALVQSLLILVVGALAFGVSWGDPPAVAALVVSWALVGAGAGLLAGTLFRTPEQAGSIGPPVGIAFAMLGGCMWPLEIVGDTMRTVGHLVPQAWAVDAWTELVGRGGGLADIGLELGVLAGFAVALLGVASVRLRRVLTA